MKFDKKNKGLNSSEVVECIELKRKSTEEIDKIIKKRKMSVECLNVNKSSLEINNNNNNGDGNDNSGVNNH